jgi:hypothetical protein
MCFTAAAVAARDAALFAAYLSGRPAAEHRAAQLCPSLPPLFHRVATLCFFSQHVAYVVHYYSLEFRLLHFCEIYYLVL